MRTITKIKVRKGWLELKRGAGVDDAARELIELLLTEQRLIWEDHEPLQPQEILGAYEGLHLRFDQEPDGMPTDPDSADIKGYAAEALGIESVGARLGTLESPQQLRYDALRHALSILAQIPVDEVDTIPNVVRVIEDREGRVFGLMFQSDCSFTFRLRYHDTEKLQAATERVVGALAPRPQKLLSSLIEHSETSAVANVREGEGIDFEQVLMKTPRGEVAQVGEVHPVGSTVNLLAYVASRSAQRVVLYLGLLFVLADLALEVFDPSIQFSHLDLTEWLAGTLGRATTAAFTAYGFSVLLEYMRLRGRLRDNRDAAMIDWTAKQAGLA